MEQTKVIAFYLPQFHPTRENDAWWGPGFTEWTNVANARPLFAGHHQPDIPADLGFYDLRLPETREAQAELARSHGIHGFCYWHYWFAGKRLLERPFEEVLRTGAPDFPFCLGWANHSWSRVWAGASNKLLIQQTYPGSEDHRAHFNALLPAFNDSRYIRIEGKPVFCIFDPKGIPNTKEALDYWRSLARAAGLPGVHFIAILEDQLMIDRSIWDPISNGYDAITVSNQTAIAWCNKNRNRRRWDLQKKLHKYMSFRKRPFHVYRYSEALEYLFAHADGVPQYQCVVPNWDNTPRHGHRGVVLTDPSPELFKVHFRSALQRTSSAKQAKIVFVKSWNEWAEGNYLEPSLRHGRGFLEVIRDELLRSEAVS